MLGLSDVTVTSSDRDNIHRDGTGFKVLWDRVIVGTLGTDYPLKSPRNQAWFPLLNLNIHPETHFPCQERLGFFWPLQKLGEITELSTGVFESPKSNSPSAVGHQQQHGFPQGETGLEKVQGADGTGVSRQTEVTGAKQGRESPESSTSQCGSVKEGPVRCGSERNCQD